MTPPGETTMAPWGRPGISGTVPVGVRHELYSHPKAPVIRSVITISDQPENPLALETMTNIAEQDQRDDFARLATQKELLLLFYDEHLQHRLSKRVGNGDPKVIEDIVQQAELLRLAIPLDRYDFMKARADVIARTWL